LPLVLLFPEATLPAHDPQRGALRIITWNVAGDSANASLASRYSPSLLLTQESAALPSQFRNPTGEFMEEQLEGKLSRLATERVDSFTAPDLLLWEVRGRRILVANLRLALPKVVLRAVRLLDPDSASQQYDSHRERAERLASLLSRTRTRVQPDAVIACGDFNLPGGSTSLSALRAIGLSDAFYSSGQLDRFTFPQLKGLPAMARVDQCWMSGELQPLMTRPISMGSSDHRALMVDLSFR